MYIDLVSVDLLLAMIGTTTQFHGNAILYDLPLGCLQWPMVSMIYTKVFQHYKVYTAQLINLNFHPLEVVAISFPITVI